MMVYKACKKTELWDAGYAILDGLGDCLCSPSALRKEPDLVWEYPWYEVVEAVQIYDVYVSREQAFKAEKFCVLWDLIFNCALDKLDHLVCECEANH